MSDIDKQKYLDWLVKLAAGDAEGACWGGECIGVLAVAPNGCWAKHPDMSASKARAKALEQCASSCDSDSCEIVDVGGESDFIKQSGPSVSAPIVASSNSESTVLATSEQHVSYMSDIDKQKYLDWLVKLAAGDAEGACWGGECIGVLAVAPNGCWAKHPDMSASKARAKALEQCASSCDSDSCEIVDVGGESDFIKQSGPSVSSSSEANRSESEPSAELEFWASVKDS
ncbi:uncharacterized protein METZ01_LOCUS113554, partial [marine metagenome]